MPTEREEPSGEGRAASLANVTSGPVPPTRIPSMNEQDLSPSASAVGSEAARRPFVIGIRLSVSADHTLYESHESGRTADQAVAE